MIQKIDWCTRKTNLFRFSEKMPFSMLSSGTLDIWRVYVVIFDIWKLSPRCSRHTKAVLAGFPVEIRPFPPKNRKWSICGHRNIRTPRATNNFLFTVVGCLPTRAKHTPQLSWSKAIFATWGEQVLFWSCCRLRESLIFLSNGVVAMQFFTSCDVLVLAACQISGNSRMKVVNRCGRGPNAS